MLPQSPCGGSRQDTATPDILSIKLLTYVGSSVYSYNRYHTHTLLALPCVSHMNIALKYLVSTTVSGLAASFQSKRALQHQRHRQDKKRKRVLNRNTTVAILMGQLAL